MIIRKINAFTSEHFDLLLSADPNKHLVDDYLKRSFCFEAFEDDTVLGVLILLPTRPETLEIVNIAVSQDHQGQGIGEQLIQFAFTQARDNAYNTVEIGTGSTSFGQLYLYQKCGFRMTSIDHDFFIRHYDEEIVENKLVLKDMVRLSIDL
jgi:GNAT superfamily N-acetyltransferase